MKCFVTIVTALALIAILPPGSTLSGEACTGIVQLGPEADFDGNGVINSLDFTNLGEHYLHACD